MTWLTTLALATVALACVGASLRKDTLCRVRRGESERGIVGVRHRLCVRWSRPDDSRVEVWSEHEQLFGGTRIMQVLQAAEELAQALELPLDVETSLSHTTPRSMPPALLSPNQRGPWHLARSGALRRAEYATWAVGIFGAIQMAVVVLSERSSVAHFHPLSLSLAMAAPLLLIGIALGLRSREPRIDVGEKLAVENHFLGRCWSRTVFERATTTYTLLQHPRLDLGFVWLRSAHQSMVLSSNAGAAAALAAYLTSHDVPDSNRGDK